MATLGSGMATNPATDADFYLKVDMGLAGSAARPKSPLHNFTKEARMGPEPRSQPQTPGPGTYYYPEPKEYSRKGSLQNGAAFGFASRVGDVWRAAEFPGVKEDDDFIPDGSEKFHQGRRAVFGKASRFDTASDLETVTACPQHKLLEESPGCLYEPRDEFTGGRNRPRSAQPCYRFSSATCERFVSKPPTSQDTPLGPSDNSLGRQWNSKKRTKHAASFPKASRFPSSKKVTEGECTAEVKQMPKFGDRAAVTGLRQRRPTSASFGSSTRDINSRTQICRTQQDRPAAMQAVRLTHHPVPPRQDVLKFNNR